MNIRQLLLALVAGILWCATMAHAHPGHGGEAAPNGLLHYVTEPMHIGFVISAIIFTAFCLNFAWQRTRSAKRLQHQSHDG